MTGPADIVVMTALGALSAACITAGLRSLVPELRLVRRMSELGASSSIGRLAERPSHGLGALLIGGEADRKEIEQSLHLAGYYSQAAPAVFAWVRVGAAAAAGLVAALVVAASGNWSSLGPFLPWAAAGVTYLGSKRLLRWSAARRRRRVEAELPFLLDILTMMLESGVSLDQSFRTLAAAEGRAGPLVHEAVRALVADLDRGMAHEAALDRWGARLGVDGARELAAMFKRNLAHGTELGGALAAFGRDFADKRVSTAREAVGRKAAQLAMVMMIFFMPALFLVLAGPAVVTLVQTLLGLAG